MHACSGRCMGGVHRRCEIARKRRSNCRHRVRVAHWRSNVAALCNVGAVVGPVAEHFAAGMGRCRGRAETCASPCARRPKPRGTNGVPSRRAGRVPPYGPSSCRHDFDTQTKAAPRRGTPTRSAPDGWHRPWVRDAASRPTPSAVRQLDAAIAPAGSARASQAREANSPRTPSRCRRPRCADQPQPPPFPHRRATTAASPPPLRVDSRRWYPPSRALGSRGCAGGRCRAAACAYSPRAARRALPPTTRDALVIATTGAASEPMCRA